MTTELHLYIRTNKFREHVLRMENVTEKLRYLKDTEK